MPALRAEEQAGIKEMSGGGEWMERTLNVQKTAACKVSVL